MFTENADVFLADFGVPCVCNARTFQGILDQPDETLAAAGVNVLSTMYTVQIKSTDAVASAIASNAAITVNGRPFVVRDVLSHEDGVFTVLTLSAS